MSITKCRQLHAKAPSMRWRGSGAVSGEVRVSYFDPRTGEPCDEKPEPLPSRRNKPDRKTSAKSRREAVEEGRRIASGMRARRKRETSRRYREARKLAKPRREPICRKGRPRCVATVVDGTAYVSIEAAAAANGMNASYLSKRLRDGATSLNGRSIAYADASGRGTL